MTIQLKRNDTKDTISYSMTYADGTPVNLTGATVRFLMGTGKSIVTDSAATIKSASSGQVEYTLKESDTLVAGTFKSEFQVTFSDGKVKTFPTNGYIMVNIQPNIDLDQSTYIEDQIANRVSDLQVWKNEIQAQLDEFAVGDSTPEVAQARVEKDGTTNTTLKARLDKKESEFSQKLSEHTSLLAQKPNKGEIKSADLKILSDSDKIQLINLSDEVKQAMAGTTPINASVANGTVTPEKTSFMNVKRTNLFDKTKAVVGTVNQTTGAITYLSESYYVSDFIEVKEGSVYKTQSTYNAGYYNSSKGFVQGVTGHGGNFTIPTGVKYVRFGFLYANIDTVMFVEGTSLPAYTPYSNYTVDIIGAEVKEAIESVAKDIPTPLSKLDYLFKEKRLNLFDKTKAVKGSIDQANGVVTGTLYMSSDFIPVEEGKSYRTQTNYNSGYYDINKNFIQGIKPVTDSPITIPTGLGIKYIRIGFHDSVLDTLMFVEGVDLPLSYVPYDYWGVVFATESQKEIFKNYLGADSSNSLFGLRFNFIGDSITGTTYGKPYHQWIAERTGMIARNYGVNGSCISVRDGVTNSIIERYPTMNTDADGVIVFGGRNDKTYNVPIGSMTDRVNNTLYGACHLLFTGLLEAYPAKKIGIMLPLQRQNEDISAMLNYINTIKEVAEYYSLPLLDLYKGSGLSPNLPSNVTNYIPDGLHPNDTGHKIISRRIEAFLRSL